MAQEIFTGHWLEVERTFKALEDDMIAVEKSLAKQIDGRNLSTYLLAVQLNCALLMEWVVRCQIAVLAAERE